MFLRNSQNYSEFTPSLPGVEVKPPKARYSRSRFPRFITVPVCTNPGIVGTASPVLYCPGRDIAESSKAFSRAPPFPTPRGVDHLILFHRLTLP